MVDNKPEFTLRVLSATEATRYFDPIPTGNVSMDSALGSLRLLNKLAAWRAKRFGESSPTVNSVLMKRNLLERKVWSLQREAA